MLKDKIKQTLIHYYKQQRGMNTQVLGKAIDWRFKLVDKLLVNRNKLSESELLNNISSFCLIHRQVEAELDIYQQQLQDLAIALENEDISQDEFEERLENITIAIIIIAFLAGSETETANQELFDNALAVLNSGGVDNTDLDISGLPTEAQDELNSEMAIALTAGAGLAEIIAEGKFEDREEALFGRLALWVTTALGIVNLGKLFLDATQFQIWLFNPLKDHCDDCFGLNGQVHTVLEWNDFFLRTGKRPQGRNLACSGFNCGCGLFNADGPSVGGFV